MKFITSNQGTEIASINSQLEQITNNGELKGIIFLTQAEYDALPASKLTDGKEYNIVES